MYYKTVEISICGHAFKIDVSCTPQTSETELIKRAYNIVIRNCEGHLRLIENEEQE